MTFNFAPHFHADSSGVDVSRVTVCRLPAGWSERRGDATATHHNISRGRRGSPSVTPAPDDVTALMLIIGRLARLFTLGLVALMSTRATRVCRNFQLLLPGNLSSGSFLRLGALALGLGT